MHHGFSDNFFPFIDTSMFVLPDLLVALVRNDTESEKLLDTNVVQGEYPISVRI